jgi:hypothetical protein
LLLTPQYKQWYLREQVPLFLKNMLSGQRVNEAMAADREARKARRPLDHATREAAGSPER